MQVDRYPAVFFIGSGNFHQSHALGSNIVRYEADIIPNALYDWIRFLSFTSRAHRVWNSFKQVSIAFWRSPDKGTIPSLSSFTTKDQEKQLLALEKEVFVLRSEVNRFEILELFDQLPDRGDAFTTLNQTPPNSVRTLDTIF
jgi:hypothetical protein